MSLFLAKKIDDLICRLPGFFDGPKLKTDGSYSGMASTPITFTNGRQVVLRGFWRPGIGTNRNFSSETRSAHRNSVGGVWKQVVRNEFVITLQTAIGKIEGHNAVVLDCPVLYQVDRPQVPLVKRLV